MTSRLRVAHFGTGHTGTQVLRQILQRPDLDPSAVGPLVHSPERVDSAELGPVGASAIADFDSSPSERRSPAAGRNKGSEK
jgi:hypothetical protein